MKLRLLLFGLLLSALSPAWAQDNEIDVTTLLADTKTFIFSDNQSTVKGYIYAIMEAQTSCCGKDRIYLEVKIDPSGYVLSAKTLTGRNECFMQSAVDIVKNIKWNTEDFKGGPRSVYFEIKPDISCDGGKANEYAALEVFNNELLNGSGTATPAPTTAANRPPSTPPANTPPTTTPQTTPTQQAQPATTTPSEPVAANNPPAQQPTAQEPEATEEEATEEPVAAAPAPTPAPTEAPTQASDEPVVVETPTARTETPSSPPGTVRPRPNTSNNSNNVAAGTPTDPPRGQDAPAQRELTEEEKQAVAKQEAERQRREEEIRQLKEEMARMRAAEEQVREERMAAEQRRQEESRNNAYSYEDDNQEYTDNGEGNGGLFFDDLPYEGDDNVAANDQVGPGEQTDPAASQEQRIRNDVSRIEQQIRELEQKNRDAENAIRSQMAEAERANREILQLAEEKARREEEAEQLREQQELDRIAENRRRVEEDRARQEQEVQRMQDELARLQSEMQTRMKDLDRQQQEIDEIAMQKQQREQEIQLTRALREKEREAELERLRLEKMNSNYMASGNLSTVDIPTDFASAADSEKYMILQAQIQALVTEVNYLRTQLGQEPIEQTVPGTTPSTDGGRSNTGSGSRTTPIRKSGGTGTTNASSDKSWEDIDIVAPGMNEEDYYVNPRPQPQTPVTQTQPGSQPAGNQGQSGTSATPQQDPSVVNYRPGRGYSPDPSHADTHENTAGPEMQRRTYVNGDAAMKDLIKENLRNGGVCGLAHVLFSATLKPDGTVVSYRVLSYNSDQVKAQMETMIPNLRFNSIDARYNQTVYQEVKAEINCDGSEDVNLQSVQPIIRE